MSLSATRAELAQTLAELLEIPAFTELPETFTGPVVIVTEDDPFLTPDEEGNTWADIAVRWEALVLAGHGTAKAMTDQLDGFLDILLPALRGKATYSGYLTITHGQRKYRACRVTVRDFITH